MSQLSLNHSDMCHRAEWICLLRLGCSGSVTFPPIWVVVVRFQSSVTGQNEQVLEPL